MSGEPENDGYGITIFSPDTPRRVKTRKLTFFIIFCLLILIQACYWLFANSAEPFVLGMPFSLFFVVLFVAIEFIALLALYFIEAEEMKDSGDAKCR